MLPLPFLQAHAACLSAFSALEQLREDSAASMAGAFVAAVREAKPRAAPPAFLPDARGEDKYQAARAWALKRLGLPAVEALELPAGMAYHAARTVLSAEVARCKAALPGLALFATFRRVPELRLVYTASDYGRSPTEAEAGANIRAAILEARGFRVELRGLEVWSDAEPGTEHALPYWRLDDKRLCRATNPVNLKCLLGGLWPFAGRWDLPPDHEIRDSDSFALHRANEDAHRAVNGPATELQLSDEACFYSWRMFRHDRSYARPAALVDAHAAGLYEGMGDDGDEEGGY